MNARLAPTPLSPRAERQPFGWAERARGGVRELAQWLAGQVAAGLCAMSSDRVAGFGQLLYHRVAPPIAGLPRPSMNVTPASFLQQLEGLLARGYRAWPLDRLLAAMRHRQEIPPRVFGLTFDDGFEAVYHHAWPVLRRLGIPATVFLSTAYLDADEPFFFDTWALRYRQRVPAESYRPLRREQCREMLDSGLVTFGSHLHTHRDWRGRPESFRRDLRMSLDVIADLTGDKPVQFAFPFGKPALGYTSPDLVQAARDVGVVCGLTTAGVVVAPGADPFTWGRFNVRDWDTPRTLSAKLSGWYGWSGLQTALAGNRGAAPPRFAARRGENAAT